MPEDSVQELMLGLCGFFFSQLAITGSTTGGCLQQKFRWPMFRGVARILVEGAPDGKTPISHMSFNDTPNPADTQDLVCTVGIGTACCERSCHPAALAFPLPECLKALKVGRPWLNPSVAGNGLASSRL